ncbi:unnamed protein product [Tetraodon nigroviridis]|uniref:(spotted green pufferfish) hypothetical protein n=1 Tax=Tetraodon nigroviridis TaxID=99883 RepID=Q4SX88_TETNG|nr:unnamed protein product [Tetraodon nigroviridis]
MMKRKGGETEKPGEEKELKNLKEEEEVNADAGEVPIKQEKEESLRKRRRRRR